MAIRCASGPETVARGETAHDRVYPELEDLGRALVGTVRSRLSRGRMMLAHKLARYMVRNAYE